MRLKIIQQMADDILASVQFKSIPVYIGSLDNGKAACYMRRNKIIVFDEEYLDSAQPNEILNTLKHEIAHYWVNRRGLSTKEFGSHNTDWYKIALYLGCDVENTLKNYPDSVHAYSEAKDYVKGNSEIVLRLELWGEEPDFFSRMFGSTVSA